MFSELFIEVLSEEIPSRMQSDMIEQIGRYFDRSSEKQKLKFESMQIFITARRVVVCLRDIYRQDGKGAEVKGPKISADKSAIEGFLKKSGKKLEELSVRTIKGEKFYCTVNNIDSQIVLKESLIVIIEGMFKGISWTSSMHWSDLNVRWIRPVLNILCLLDGKVLNVDCAGVVSNDRTIGHKFLSRSGFFPVENFADYKVKMAESYVILDYEERKKFILSQIDNLIGSSGLLKCEINEKLLNEVAGIVEYPTMILGKIDDQFFSLPSQVVLNVLHYHQRYFAVLQDEIITHFIATVTVSNEKVVKGNEKVLRARLSDAKFLIEQDLERGLESYADQLSGITFHAKLGSLANKVKRVVALAKYLTVWVPQASLIHVERAASLAKVDLATLMVKEFPELQGVMGGYYARCLGEHPAVCRAISEHYQPLGLGYACPTAPTSIAVSLADKVDSLVGLVAVGEQPTGSGDPFAIRRMAIGILRTIVTNGLQVPIGLLCEKAVSLYPKTIYLRKLHSNEDAEYTKKELIDVIVGFCCDRFRVMVRDSSIDLAVIGAVLDIRKFDNVVLLDKQIRTLSEYLADDQGSALVNSYKRINNLIVKAEKSDEVVHSGTPKKSLLVEQEEILLMQSIKMVSKYISRALKNQDIQGALVALSAFAKVIDEFMNKVKIQSSEKPELRRNRLIIASKARAVFHIFADFSRFCI